MAQTPTPWRSEPDRPWNLPGLNRDNAPSRRVDPSLVQRISSGLRSWLGMSTGPGSPELPFFPPGRPLDPMAQGAIGRRFDYPTNYNAVIRPRSYEPIDFDTLRAIADPSCSGWDLVRLAVETRKDQMSKLTYSVLPRKPANATIRPKSDARCQKVEQFLRRPDGDHSWETWVRILLEEQLVIDAPAIYRRPTLSGDVARLEILDGATIKPVLNYDGRRPDQGPAYQQILKGLPAVWYTPDELIYAPRNPRASKVYGYSCVEQVIVTVNIGLRRQASQLGYFSEGNVPDAVAQVPQDWPIQKIQEFQDYWDTMVNDAVRRRKMRFIPGGVQFQPTRNDQALVDQFDEWLARVVQYCFSLPPTPLVRMMNRATSESAYEESLDEGLQPMMAWLKNIIDDIIVRWFKLPDLEFVWDDIKKVDPAEKEERDMALVQQGIISRDDMRADRGLEPLGVPPIVQGIGPLGFMSIDAMKKAIAAGWDLNGMPQPQPALGGMPGAPGGETGPGEDPALLGTGQDGDPLNGLPKEIREALGVVETPEGGDAANPDQGAIAPADAPMPPGRDLPPKAGALSVPTARGQGNVVPLHRHPGVLAALRHGDAQAKRAAARMAGGAR